jgi:Tfp pilus assembly protein PilN
VFGWPLLLAWGFALLVAIVVLGFCGYELRWKIARAQRDASRLSTVLAEAAALQAQLQQVQARIAGARALSGSGTSASTAQAATNAPVSGAA